MSDDDPLVPIICPECNTETRVPLSDLESQLRTHNENQHDGEECATVDPALADHLQDMVAEDMGLLE